MATDAERVSRALQWFADHAASLSAQAARPLEVALVCRAAGAPFPAGISATGLSAALVNAVMGTTVFPGAPAYDGSLADADRVDLQWAHAVLSGGAPPPLALPDEDGYALTHAIMFAAEFTVDALSDPTAAVRVNAALAAEASNRDLQGEYLVSLLCLGESPGLPDYEAWWDGAWGECESCYHPILVGALFFAMRGG